VFTAKDLFSPRQRESRKCDPDICCLRWPQFHRLSVDVQALIHCVDGMIHAMSRPCECEMGLHCYLETPLFDYTEAALQSSFSYPPHHGASFERRRRRVFAGRAIRSYSRLACVGVSVSCLMALLQSPAFVAGCLMKGIVGFPIIPSRSEDQLEQSVVKFSTSKMVNSDESSLLYQKPLHRDADRRELQRVRNTYVGWWLATDSCRMSHRRLPSNDLIASRRSVDRADDNPTVPTSVPFAVWVIERLEGNLHTLYIGSNHPS
jgi:hypothetical protein